MGHKIRDYFDIVLIIFKVVSVFNLVLVCFLRQFDSICDLTTQNRQKSNAKKDKNKIKYDFFLIANNCNMYIDICWRS